MDFFNRFPFCIVCVVVYLFSFNAAAANKEYLDNSGSEAKTVKPDLAGEPENKAFGGFTWEGNLEDESIPAGLEQDEFVTFLKQRFYGTFVFYRKLNSIDKNTVYNHYHGDISASLDSIRQDIMTHMKR